MANPLQYLDDILAGIDQTLAEAAGAAARK
jgi:hypothetical protein